MDGGVKKNIWVIANWKSNKTIAEALDWISRVGSDIPKKEELKVVVCPTFSVLSEAKKTITVGNFPLLVGTQDLSPFGAGAYTGEEPAELLSGLAGMAILGHSERRQNFGETDEMIAKKVAEAKTNNIIPLVCVQGPDTSIPSDCKIVAYEPVSAIGTGLSDTPEDANQIAKRLKEKYGRDLEVLYGGSVTGENAKSFILQPYINGMLVGKASLDAEEFIKICKIMEQI